MWKPKQQRRAPSPSANSVAKYSPRAMGNLIEQKVHNLEKRRQTNLTKNAVIRWRRRLKENQEARRPKWLGKIEAEIRRA